MNPYPEDNSSGSDAQRKIVAFVNKNSGERAAASFVREQLETCLGKDNVFDLFPTAGQPPVIDEAKAFLLEKMPDMIIVAGGDGTVSLGMDICDTLRSEGRIGKWSCPVAVLPMGTGNDLSRSLGFGGGYTKPLANPEKKFAKLIEKTSKARQKLVDRFRCDIYLTPEATNSSDGEDEPEANPTTNRFDESLHSASEEKGRVPPTYSNSEGQEQLNPTEASATHAVNQAARADSDAEELGYRPPRNGKKVFSNHLMNYFSVGFDADIATDFGQFREDHPKACTNRGLNKMWYFFFGCKALCCSSRLPKQRISLHIDNVKMKVSSKAEAIVVSNMLTYAGGAVLWQDPKKKFPPPAVDDKKAETCVLNGVMHMVGVGAHTRSAKKMGQGSTIRIRVPADYAMQYDGEPIAALGKSNEDCVVYITHIGQSLGMELSGGKKVTAQDDDNDAEDGPPQNVDNPIGTRQE